MTQSTPHATASTRPASTWNEDVLRELLALPYVRAVVFTNGSGRALHVGRRRATPPALAKAADLARAALGRAGETLQLGEIQVNACVYEEGTLVLAGAGSLRVVVLADVGANLGALLNEVRRLFRPEGAS